MLTFNSRVIRFKTICHTSNDLINVLYPKGQETANNMSFQHPLTF